MGTQLPDSREEDQPERAAGERSPRGTQESGWTAAVIRVMCAGHGVRSVKFKALWAMRSDERGLVNWL